MNASTLLPARTGCRWRRWLTPEYLALAGNCCQQRSHYAWCCIGQLPRAQSMQMRPKTTAMLFGSSAAFRLTAASWASIRKPQPAFNIYLLSFFRYASLRAIFAVRLPRTMFIRTLRDNILSICGAYIDCWSANSNIYSINTYLVSAFFAKCLG